MQQDLLRSLYRFDCPSPHTLGEYELGLLEAAQRTSVAAHATDCDECRAELQMLRLYLAAPTAVSESVVERVKRVVASLFVPAPGLAYGGLRGAALTTTRVYEAGDVTVTIGPGQTSGTLVGLVVAGGAGTPASLMGRAARLVPASGSPVSVVLDELGNFEFADLAAGVYALELDLPASLVVIEALPID